MKNAFVPVCVLLLVAGCTREETVLIPCDAGTVYNDDLTECSRCAAGLTRIETDGGFICSDAGPCQGLCTGGQVCRVADNVCVDCLVDGDCTDPDNAKCGPDGSCGPCDANSQCTGITDRSICDLGACVACSASNDSACGGNPCNPATGTCSAFGTASAATCEPCDTDANCSVANQRCIELMFGGSVRGGYCLLENTGSCPAPFQVGITRASLSGAAAATYCGINEALTTCEAVQLRDQPCAACQSVDGARCETLVATGMAACTYSCSTASECNTTGNLSGCDTGAGGFCGS